MVSVMITRDQCRAARGYLGITQKQLAEMAGINHNTIHGWETGRIGSHHATLQVIERALTEQGIIFGDGSVSLRKIPDGERTEA